MAITTISALTTKGSQHDVVFSEDPDVKGSPVVGWIPVERAQTIGAGADRITIRGLSPDPELAQVRDKRLRAGPSQSDLLACHLGILRVNGKTNLVEDWINSVFLKNPSVIETLAMYIVAVSKGEDPIETVSPLLERAGKMLEVSPPAATKS